MKRDLGVAKVIKNGGHYHIKKLIIIHCLSIRVAKGNLGFSLGKAIGDDDAEYEGAEDDQRQRRRHQPKPAPPRPIPRPPTRADRRRVDIRRRRRLRRL